MKLHCAVECNGCGVRVTSDLDLTGKSLSVAYGAAKRNAKKEGWLCKNEGSKGHKHFCPKSIDAIPELRSKLMKDALVKGRANFGW